MSSETCLMQPQHQAISTGSSNAPMAPVANAFNTNPAKGIGGTYVVNATGWQAGIGQGTGIPPLGEGQVANVQMANTPVNASATFVGGLSLQGQAAAGLVAPRMASLPVQRLPPQIAQATAPQMALTMAQKQASLQQQQQQHVRFPVAAAPMPMQPIRPAPRPPVRPLIQPVVQPQQTPHLRNIDKQPIAQQEREAVVQNYAREQVAQYPVPGQAASPLRTIQRNRHGLRTPSPLLMENVAQPQQRQHPGL